MLKPVKISLINVSLFGEGSVGLLSDELCSKKYKKALIITDSFLAESDLISNVTEAVARGNVEYAVFDGVQPNPTVDVVERCFIMAKSVSADCLIAFGGGSAIDTAKAVGILCTNGGNIRDYEGTQKSRYKSLPLIAINTTAGTGSEATSFYIVTDPLTHSKMVMVDNNCTVEIAINDPNMMKSMPSRLTAATGMDAMTHAIEAILSIGASPFTDHEAEWAIRLISQHLPKAVSDGNCMQSRTMMAYAEYAAGVAFSNAGLGMVHAMAHSLGGMYNLPHGVCNAVLLPYVMEFNGADKNTHDNFKKIIMGLNIRGAEWFPPYRAMLESIKYIKKLLKLVGLPEKLRELNVHQEDFLKLAELAMRDACMTSNPKTPDIDDVINVYKRAY